MKMPNPWSMMALQSSISKPNAAMEVGTQPSQAFPPTQMPEPLSVVPRGTIPVQESIWQQLAKVQGVKA